MTTHRDDFSQKIKDDLDASMTSQERSSFENGIWLCANCSTLIDKDERYYTVELLKNWPQEKFLYL